MRKIRHFFYLFFFFFLGAVLASVVIVSISYLFFSYYFRDKIYPGVTVSGLDLSEKTPAQVIDLYSQKSFPDITITIQAKDATISATSQSLSLKYDSALIASRAYSIGRQTKNPYYNFQQIIAAWRGTIDLPTEITFDSQSLNSQLTKIAPKIEINPVDAVYQFTPNIGPDNRGRVQAFTPSSDGLIIDRPKLIEEISNQAKDFARGKIIATSWQFSLPTKIVSPTIKSSTADDLGIKTLLGEGLSYFYDSIPGRIYNIGLAASKVNGRLVAPDEVFSFSESIGTVSAIFGYQKAYSIIKGKTVLDDGGGVCQVSTTLYRAVLNSGLPVIDRTAHTYRVGFYEEGGFLPGLDATVYPPDPDFKFKNDTGSTILIQATYDVPHARLTFDLFGTDDGRKTKINGPYFISTTPPPDTIYEDDPTKPVGTMTQVDTAHAGAKVYFQRIVTRGTGTLINETVYSDYVPWPARFLKGTKT